MLQAPRPRLGQDGPAGEHLGVAQVPDQVRAGAQARVVAGLGGRRGGRHPSNVAPNAGRRLTFGDRPPAGRSRRSPSWGPARPLEVSGRQGGSRGDLRPQGGERDLGGRRGGTKERGDPACRGVRRGGHLLGRHPHPGGRAGRLLDSDLPHLPGRDQGRAVHVPGAHGRRAHLQPRQARRSARVLQPGGLDPALGGALAPRGSSSTTRRPWRSRRSSCPGRARCAWSSSPRRSAARCGPRTWSPSAPWPGSSPSTRRPSRSWCSAATPTSRGWPRPTSPPFAPAGDESGDLKGSLAIVEPVEVEADRHPDVRATRRSPWAPSPPA